MSEGEAVPAVTMANTKKEMLTAYQQMKQALQQQEKQLLDADKERARLKKAAAVATAERAAEEDPVARIHELKSTIGRELTGLGDKFDEAREEYAGLKLAIAERQEELKRIYEVETAAGDLAALIEAQRQRKEDFESEMASRKAALETEIGETKAAWETETQGRAQAGAEEREAETRRREREQEEYDYKLAREREQRRNELEDEMAGLTKEIGAKREEFERGVAEKEAELNLREESVAQREARADELQQQVDGFPAQLEQSVSTAVADVRERLTAEFTAKQALLEKGFEGERNVLSGKIESLDKLVAGQAKQIDALAKQQEKAYEKVQDIATKAVESAQRQPATTVAIPVSPRPEQEGGQARQ